VCGTACALRPFPRCGCCGWAWTSCAHASKGARLDAVAHQRGVNHHWLCLIVACVCRYSLVAVVIAGTDIPQFRSRVHIGRMSKMSVRVSIGPVSLTTQRKENNSGEVRGVCVVFARRRSLLSYGRSGAVVAAWLLSLSLLMAVGIVMWWWWSSSCCWSFAPRRWCGVRSSSTRSCHFPATLTRFPTSSCTSWTVMTGVVVR
jgi:hypothetical protein